MLESCLMSKVAEDMDANPPARKKTPDGNTNGLAFCSDIKVSQDRIQLDVLNKR